MPPKPVFGPSVVHGGQRAEREREHLRQRGARRELRDEVQEGLAEAVALLRGHGRVRVGHQRRDVQA